MNDAERFWSYVEKTDDCWWWKPTKARNMYGAFSLNGKKRNAHRVAYEFAIGPIPTGLSLLHQCDNPACVNPAHLRPGTQAENRAEWVARRPDLRRYRADHKGKHGMASPDYPRKPKVGTDV